MGFYKKGAYLHIKHLGLFVEILNQLWQIFIITKGKLLQKYNPDIWSHWQPGNSIPGIIPMASTKSNSNRSWLWSSSNMSGRNPVQTFV